jgi:vacuolar-type H+-ATPase subunit I/STV1
MIYSFLYVLAMSIAIVLIQKLDMSIPPLFSLLITASIASFYFNIIKSKWSHQEQPPIYFYAAAKYSEIIFFAIAS